MGTPRAAAILGSFFALTVPLMPVQAVLLRTSTKAARRFPHWYHRKVCRILGVDLQIDGEVVRNTPVLLVSNHTSWLDIPVLSAVAPVSFVAKKEVASWPFVSWLAKLQRSVFVDRTKRHATGDTADEISSRLAIGDTIVLFAEGTSSDGNRVLPFKTSLFGAVKGRSTVETDIVVQTCVVVYSHHHGLPLSRADRSGIAWYGDMEMQSHAWHILKSGPLTATVRIGSPVPLSDYKDRKHLASESERAIRRQVTAILRGRPEDETLQAVEPPAEARRATVARPASESEKWT
jgi:lyso-ornithine lipid O-acyltransferase